MERKLIPELHINQNEEYSYHFLAMNTIHHMLVCPSSLMVLKDDPTERRFVVFLFLEEKLT